MNRKKEACRCNNVTYGAIEAAVKAGARTYEDVQKLTRAGTGCGKCKEFISCLIQEYLRYYDAAEH